MDDRDRVRKELESCREFERFFRKNFGSVSGFDKISSYVSNYLSDASHYLEQGDLLTAFACANYAYGIMEGVLISKTNKTFSEHQSNSDEEGDL